MMTSGDSEEGFIVHFARLFRSALSLLSVPLETLYCQVC